MPVPLFTHEDTLRKQYYQNWLETLLYRDAARIFGRNYDPDQAFSILRQFGQLLTEGELPTLKHFKLNSRKLKRYLEAFEMIFLLTKIPCHELGVGYDAWLPSDCGLGAYLAGSIFGEGISLSLTRIFILNEILALNEYSGNPIRPIYFKSARGSPVDLIWNQIPIKVSVASPGHAAYEERALAGCMKKLNSPLGILITSSDQIDIPKKSGIAHVPWTYWS